MEPTEQRRIGRREVLIGATGLVGASAVAVVATWRTSSHSSGTATTTEPSAVPDATDAGAAKAPAAKAPVTYAHDVPRVPQDPSTGVAGWPMDPAGAQLVQAPV